MSIPRDPRPIKEDHEPPRWLRYTELLRAARFALRQRRRCVLSIHRADWQRHGCPDEIEWEGRSVPIHPTATIRGGVYQIYPTTTKRRRAA